MNTVGALPPETGGILGESGGVVCAFFFDAIGGAPDTYAPSTTLLNEQIALWQEQGISFAGIVHSHPNGVNCLSPRDMAYAEEIFFSNPQMREILFPIVTLRQGVPQLTGHVFDGAWRVEEVRLFSRGEGVE